MVGTELAGDRHGLSWPILVIIFPQFCMQVVGLTAFCMGSHWSQESWFPKTGWVFRPLPILGCRKMVLNSYLPPSLEMALLPCWCEIPSSVPRGIPGEFHGEKRFTAPPPPHPSVVSPQPPTLLLPYFRTYLLMSLCWIDWGWLSKIISCTVSLREALEALPKDAQRT